VLPAAAVFLEHYHFVAEELEGLAHIVFQSRTLDLRSKWARSSTLKPINQAARDPVLLLTWPRGTILNLEM
jgi:hypothetical protein